MKTRFKINTCKFRFNTIGFISYYCKWLVLSALSSTQNFTQQFSSHLTFLRSSETTHTGGCVRCVLCVCVCVCVRKKGRKNFPHHCCAVPRNVHFVLWQDKTELKKPHRTPALRKSHLLHLRRSQPVISKCFKLTENKHRQADSAVRCTERRYKAGWPVSCMFVCLWGIWRGNFVQVQRGGGGGFTSHIYFLCSPGSEDMWTAGSVNALWLTAKLTRHSWCSLAITLCCMTFESSQYWQHRRRLSKVIRPAWLKIHLLNKSQIFRHA